MNYRKKLIRIVTFLGGIYFFLEFLLPPEFFGIKIAANHENVSNGLVTVAQMALGLGLINILMVHGSKLARLKRGYINSLALLCGLGLMFFTTYLDWREGSSISDDAARLFNLRDFAQRIVSDQEKQVTGVLPAPERNATLFRALTPLLDDILNPAPAPDASLVVTSAYKDLLTKRDAVRSLAENHAVSNNPTLAEELGELGALRLEYLTEYSRTSLTKKMYSFLYDGLFISLGAAMFALLGFYIASAAFRAFRIKSMESALMMGAALIVMLGQIPFGLWIWEGFPDVRLWLLSVPSAGAFRAIKIGAAVAGLIMAYRMWLSIESEKFGRS